MAPKTSKTALSAGAVSAPESTTTALDRFEATLPSGKVASILSRGTGKTLQKAERLTGHGVPTGSMTWVLAMIAVKVRIDGEDLTIEDAEELDDADILVLMQHLTGKGS